MAPASGCTRVRYSFGLILCSLLFLFAVGAKTAVYRPHQEQIKTLTAAKVRQNDAVPLTEVAPLEQATFVCLLAALLFVSASADAEKVREERKPLALANWYWPDLAVRPPPSI